MSRALLHFAHKLPLVAVFGLFLIFSFTETDAQTTSKGFLTLKGKVVDEGSKLSGVTIKVEKAGQEIEQQITDNKGRFEFRLKFDADHKVFFSKPGYVDLILEVLTAQVPSADWSIEPVYNISEVAMFQPDIGYLNIKKFQQPFARLIYNSEEKGFMDDEVYQENFQKGLFIDPTETAFQTSEAIVARQKATDFSGSELTPISGIFQQAQTGAPLQFKVVRLLNEAGNVLETTITNEKGAFTFAKLPADQAFMVQVEAEDGSIPPDTDYVLTNRHGTRIQRYRSMAPGTIEATFKGSENEVNLLRLSETEVALDLKGKLLVAASKAPVQKANLTLVDAAGNQLYASTDENGIFSFVNLVINQKIALSSGPELARLGKLIIVNEQGEVIKEITPSADGFQFDLLPPEQVSMGTLHLEDDTEIISGALILGGKESKPLAFRKIELVDENGKVIETVTTNAFGSFVFSKLPADNNYLVRLQLEDSELDQPVILADHHYRPVKRMTAGTTGTLKFQLQEGNTNLVRLLMVDRSEVRMDIQGQLRSGNGATEAMSNLPLQLTDGKGNRFSTTTDGKGRFKFVDLFPGRNYSVNIDENDLRLLKVRTLIVADVDGNTIRRIKVEPNKDFNYTFLPGDQHQLSDYYVEDPWLDLAQSDGLQANGKQVVIREKIFFPLNDSQLQEDTRLMLDKVVEVLRMNPKLKIELSAHTDSRGNDDYNLQLSQQRAKAARQYIVGKGVAAGRITYQGFGETQLVNRCGNGTDCSEAEHAENRRVEFRVLR
ncbi:MAG: OmpA family protein [Salibacteraceae bacterium]